MFSLNPDQLKISRQRFEESIFFRREYQQLHNPLSWTDYLFDLVQTGQFDQVLDQLNQPWDWTPGQLAEDELRSHKNLAICLITELTSKSLSHHLLTSDIGFSLTDSSIQLLEKAQSQLAVSDCLIAFIYLLMEEIQDQPRQSQHHLVILTKKYIHKHFNSKIRIADLAKDIQTSASYLSTIFKQEEKMTIQAYIQQERIQRAKQMLVHSDLSLTSISQLTGFTSQSHFGKVMKALEGMTPRQYRLKYNKHYSHI
ncbi:helix-turn-helix domain-containing protein [Streptococcus cuniculipharyngis]|uniref:Helix-turn-helix transcriptional regulator n=1 Tax=Streptococcus cuniculipharyngis TaxID=1562651 RepID=A0A5C5SAL0_9STRE|nr:AraC family transcriptional regulator [Streptococcus cuniculipharyngis]TWS96188.1 helix-turn-helix transcriptional regulator [Streptococcus cuniculipharyngis]